MCGYCCLLERVLWKLFWICCWFVKTDMMCLFRDEKKNCWNHLTKKMFSFNQNVQMKHFVWITISSAHSLVRKCICNKFSANFNTIFFIISLMFPYRIFHCLKVRVQNLHKFHPLRNSLGIWFCVENCIFFDIIVIPSILYSILNEKIYILIGCVFGFFLSFFLDFDSYFIATDKIGFDERKKKTEIILDYNLKLIFCNENY